MHLTRNFFNNALKVNENREKFLNMSIDEKRKYYSCKDNYITLNEIPTWDEYYKKAELAEKIGNKYLFFLLAGK